MGAIFGQNLGKLVFVFIYFGAFLSVSLSDLCLKMNSCVETTHFLMENNGNKL
jgi:hypothetical protein